MLRSLNVFFIWRFLWKKPNSAVLAFCDEVSVFYNDLLIGIDNINASAHENAGVGRNHGDSANKIILIVVQQKGSPLYVFWKKLNEMEDLDLHEKEVRGLKMFGNE